MIEYNKVLNKIFGDKNINVTEPNFYGPKAVFAGKKNYYVINIDHGYNRMDMKSIWLISVYKVNKKEVELFKNYRGIQSGTADDNLMKVLADVTNETYHLPSSIKLLEQKLPRENFTETQLNAYAQALKLKYALIAKKEK